MAVEKLLEIKVPERAEFIRVITCELNRITSHLLWFGAYLMDLGAFTPFLYCFDDREHILDLLDGVTGSRLTYCYYRFGGVPTDIDADFVAGCRAFVSRLRSRWDDYHNLVTKNVIFINRPKAWGSSPGPVRQIRHHRPQPPGQRHPLRYPQERTLFRLSRV
jgi:NADH-quinone oxidoreductase subunit D